MCFTTLTTLDQGKQPAATHGIGGWIGPKAGMEDMERRKFPSPAQNRSMIRPIVEPEA